MVVKTVRFWFVFCFLFIGYQCWGDEARSVLLELKGHLDREKIEEAVGILESLPDNIDQLVIEIDSSSGDIYRVFSMARKIHKMQSYRDIHVIAYIDNDAIGPVAIIPFFADELYASDNARWGDITADYRGEVAYPLVRSKVRNLFSLEANRNFLEMLACAMIDPEEEFEIREDIIVPLGETLIVDTDQMAEVDLLTGIMPLHEFLAQFSFMQTPHLDKTELFNKIIHSELVQNIQYNLDGPNTVGHIYIGGHDKHINEVTWLYVKSALEYYRETQPIFVILEINTPGGEVFAAQQISDALKNLDYIDSIPVIAIIDNWAISAGAMLAYSCRFIAVVDSAIMGAAEPVYQKGMEIESAPEKVTSALRADMATRAAFFDRSALIAKAMVDKDLIVVWRHGEGEPLQLESEDQIITTGPNPDIVITRKGKLLTLDAKEMMKFDVAEIYLGRPKAPPLTPEERAVGFWPTSKSFLWQDSFFAQIPNATIDAYQMGWRLELFSFLTNPVVQSLLVLGLMLGFYLEIMTPGFGWAGSIALACVALIVLSSFSGTAVQWLEVVVLGVGILLLAIEVFAIPGFGFVGVLGLLFIAGGIISLVLPEIGTLDSLINEGALTAAGHYFIEKLAWLAGTFIIGFIFIIVFSRFVIPKFAIFNRLVSQGEQTGFVAGAEVEELPPIGSLGAALSPLCPAGKALFSSKVYDVTSRGVFIKKGVEVVVVAIDNGRLIVDSKK